MVSAAVRSFTFAVACAGCGAALDYEARAEDYEAVQRAVGVCGGCGRRWVYTVTVRPEASP